MDGGGSTGRTRTRGIAGDGQDSGVRANRARAAAGERIRVREEPPRQIVMTGGTYASE
jgi:hypothetical protein